MFFVILQPSNQIFRDKDLKTLPRCVDLALSLPAQSKIQLAFTIITIQKSPYNITLASGYRASANLHPWCLFVIMVIGYKYNVSITEI